MLAEIRYSPIATIPGGNSPNPLANFVPVPTYIRPWEMDGPLIPPLVNTPASTRPVLASRASVLSLKNVTITEFLLSSMDGASDFAAAGNRRGAC